MQRRRKRKLERQKTRKRKLERQSSAGLKKVDKETYSITPCEWGYVRIAHLLGEQERGDQRALTAWVESPRQKKYGKLKLDWQSPKAFSQPWKFQKVEPHN